MKRQFTTPWFANHEHHFRAHLWPRRGRKLRALEIGSFEGRSAVWMLEKILTHPESHLVTIDPHDYSASPTSLPGQASKLPQRRDLAAVRQRFLANTRDFREAGRHTHLAVASHVGLSLLSLTDTFDFIYVDGSHYGSDVLLDACLAWLLTDSGSIMAFDDYAWANDALEKDRHLGRPKIAIDAFLEIFKHQYRRLKLDPPRAHAQVWIERTAVNPCAVPDHHKESK